MIKEKKYEFTKRDMCKILYNNETYIIMRSNIMISNQ